MYLHEWEEMWTPAAIPYRAMSSVRSGSNQTATNEPGEGWDIRSVGPDLVEQAAHRLVEASAPGDGDAGRRFLAAARTNHIALDNFRVSVDQGNGRVREAVLIVPGAGHTGMVFTSQPKDTTAQSELAAVLSSACRAAKGMKLAQALLLPSEGGVTAALSLAGFQNLAGLAYMRRRGDHRSMIAPAGPFAEAIGADSVRWEVDHERMPKGGTRGGTVVERYGALIARVGRDAARHMLRDALIASYRETLDCPELCRLRDPEDVLESHLAVGTHDPTLWWVVRSDSSPLGAMLWSPLAGGTEPARDTAELVYIGLAPELRGIGLGGHLLSYGLAELDQRRIHEATCAVDLTNEPALALYAAHGFRRFAERVAWVKPAG